MVYFHQQNNSHVIESLAPRKSQLQRPDPYGKMKTVAANIDQMLVTIACEPAPMENLIDRYLVAAELANIDAIIVINKMDLIQEYSDQRDAILTLANRYRQIGYHVVTVSSKEANGVDALIPIVTEKLSVFVGQSGVGKSSIIQQLLPDEQIKIGEISQSTIKGKHTTTHSQLFHFKSGGAFVDSPGIREFGLWHVDEENVIRGFKEIYAFTDQCKFRNCTHKQEPGCAVQKALKNGAISQERYKSYQRILQTINDINIRK